MDPWRALIRQAEIQIDLLEKVMIGLKHIDLKHGTVFPYDSTLPFLFFTRTLLNFPSWFFFFLSSSVHSISHHHTNARRSLCLSQLRLFQSLADMLIPSQTPVLSLQCCLSSSSLSLLSSLCPLSSSLLSVRQVWREQIRPAKLSHTHTQLQSS